MKSDKNDSKNETIIKEIEEKDKLLKCKTEELQKMEIRYMHRKILFRNKPTKER